MPFHQPDRVRYFTFDLFEEHPVVQAVFTRHGGVSPAPWADLNLGGTVGDDPENVLTNKHLALETCSRTPQSVFDVWQVHSADVVTAEAPRPLHTPHQKADAILTNRPELTLMMRFADCVPVFIYDPEHHAIALVHAGWMGTVNGVVRSAVRAMKEQFASRPASLLAGIGPSIGPDHYQVGADVINQVHMAFGAEAPRLLPQVEVHTHFDLWNANRTLLEAEGVRQIEIAGICTACHLEDWFSHRAEHGKTGRFGALLALRQAAH